MNLHLRKEARFFEIEPYLIELISDSIFSKQAENLAEHQQ